MAQEIRRHSWVSDYNSITVGRRSTGRARSCKKPRPLGSRGFAARAKGLHFGTNYLMLYPSPLLFCVRSWSRHIAPGNELSLLVTCSGGVGAREQFRRFEISELTASDYPFGLLRRLPDVIE